MGDEKLTDAKKDLTVTGGSGQLSTENSLALGQTEILDLTGLTSMQIAELKRQHVGGLIDVQKKAQEMKVDVAALDATFQVLTEQTSKATQSGAHVTTTHTQTTSIGRTETVIGNTDRAASGKLSRSASGQPDNMLIYVIIGAVALVIVAFLAFGR